MAIRIKARAGETAEQLMRRFKKMCEKEGLTKDIKRQAYYEKPSERARRQARKSLKRAQIAANPALALAQQERRKERRGGGGPM